jgi:hypothetical protein
MKQGNGRGVIEDSSFNLKASENAVKKHPGFPFHWSTARQSVEIQGKSRSLILDTGTNNSKLQTGKLPRWNKSGVTGDVLDVRGQVMYFHAERK